jgi:hypothetical protein
MKEIEIPFGAYDSELYYQEITIPEGFEATIQDGKVILKRKETEDEQHRKWILEYLYDGLRKSDEQFKPQFEWAIAWLKKQGQSFPILSNSSKTVKDWTEEDAKAIDNCCLLIGAADECYEKAFKDACIHYLQNLKQRMEQ